MRQFVIQMDNRPGELAHLVRALAARGINIEHLACVGAGPLAGCFVVPGDAVAMREVLRGIGHAYIEGDTVTAKVPDRPGGLAETTDRLAAAGVNVIGMLCIGRQPGIVEMAITVDDEQRALAALSEAAPHPEVASAAEAAEVAPA